MPEHNKEITSFKVLRTDGFEIRILDLAKQPNYNKKKKTPCMKTQILPSLSFILKKLHENIIQKDNK